VANGKSFAPEFRQEAVRLYRVSGRPFRAVAGGARRGARVAAPLGAADGDRSGQPISAKRVAMLLAC